MKVISWGSNLVNMKNKNKINDLKFLTTINKTSFTELSSIDDDPVAGILNESKNIVINEQIEKNYIQKSFNKANEADYFLINLIDEMYDLAIMNKKYYSLSYDLKSSKEIINLVKEGKLSIIENTFELWKKGFDIFLRRLLTEFSEDKIIIIESYLCEMYMEDNQIKYFSNSNSIKHKNIEIGKMYEYIKRQIPDVNWIGSNKKMQSEKWGNIVQPYLYSEKYYEETVNELYNTYDLTMEYYKIPVVPNIEIKLSPEIDLHFKYGGSTKLEKRVEGEYSPTLIWEKNKTNLPKLKVDAEYSIKIKTEDNLDRGNLVGTVYFYKNNTILERKDITEIGEIITIPSEYDSYCLEIGIKDVGRSTLEYIEIKRNRLKGNVLARDKKKFFNDSEAMTYYLKKSSTNSNKLLLVFSGFSPYNTKYEFLSLVKKYDVNIMFILDDYGINGRFYQDKSKKNNLQRNIISEIDNVRKDLKIEWADVTTLGGSKGGSAALYYGLAMKVGNILSASPPIDLSYYTTTKILHHANLVTEITPDSDLDYLSDFILSVASEENIITKVYFMSITNDIYYEVIFNEKVKLLDKYNISYDNKIFLGNGHSDVPKYLLQWSIMHLDIILIAYNKGRKDEDN